MKIGDSTKTLRQRYNLSESGITSLKDRLVELEQSRTDHIKRLRMLKEQQSDGVSLEDSSYIQTLSGIQFIETEMDKIRYILNNATVVDAKSVNLDCVNVGSRVRLEGQGKRFEYTIVNSIEADPFNGKISDESPLGKQLLGKKIQEMVTVGPLQKPQLFKLTSIS
jgi:transcription elongation factor GreA